MIVLGHFEIDVLSAVLQNRGNAYGVSIANTINEFRPREVAMGAVYSTLDRLERKGLICSSWSIPSAERGGRRKRMFEITADGLQAMRDCRDRMARFDAFASI